MTRCHVIRFIICYLIICLLIIVNKRYCQTKHNIITNDAKSIKNKSITFTSASQSNSSMKYILLWTKSKYYPFVYFGEGNSIFVNKSCKWTNCYVTEDRYYLGSHTQFEVIAFNGPQLNIESIDLPSRRHVRQKFVYANIESSENYPFRNIKLNDFFNWTWTYKLNSDAVWGYIIVRDANKKVIGPREHMHWLRVDGMDPIGQDLKQRLKRKKYAVAWFSSNCLTPSHREEYINAAKFYLSFYNLTVDVYGECGDRQCPRKIMRNCLRMLRRHYYFYFAFENSFSEDYVTEKILHALKYETVPVVYGGANYTRFMPDGIYLNAKELSPKKLAQTIHKLMKNPVAYQKYFRWKKYYSFHAPHESPETDSYCEFCAMINNATLIQDHKSYHHFNRWWTNNITGINHFFNYFLE